MTRISKATAILLLGAGMSLFAADTAATSNTDQTVQTQSGDQTTQTQQSDNHDQTVSQESDTAGQNSQETAQNQQDSDNDVQQNDNGANSNIQQNDSTENSKSGTQAQASSGINVEVQKIMQADPSARRALMNQFKEKLATMNQNDRMAAISQLRSAMQTEGMHQAQSHMQQGAQMAQNGMKIGHHAMKSGMSMGQMSHGNGAMQESGNEPDMGSMMQGGLSGNNMPTMAPQTSGGSNQPNHGAAQNGNMAAMPHMQDSGMPTMVSQSDTSSHQAPAAQPATPAVPAQPAPATQPSNGVPQTAPTPNMAVQPTMPSATAQTGVRSHSGGAMGMNMMGHR